MPFLRLAAIGYCGKSADEHGRELRNNELVQSQQHNINASESKRFGMARNSIAAICFEIFLLGKYRTIAYWQRARRRP